MAAMAEDLAPCFPSDPSASLSKVASDASERFGKAASDASQRFEKVANQVRSDNPEAYAAVENQCNVAQATAKVLWSEGSKGLAMAATHIQKESPRALHAAQSTANVLWSGASEKLGKVATQVKQESPRALNAAQSTANVLWSGASEKLGKVASQVKQESPRAAVKTVETAQHTGCVLWTETFLLVTTPFFPYLLVTYLLNIPPFAYGLASLFSPDCNSAWLFFNSFFSVIHMGISVYVVTRIRGKYTLKQTEVPADGTTDAPYIKVDASMKPGGEPNSWDRIRIVLFYDMVMAVYYILCILWITWQGIGTSRIVNNEVDEGCGRWVVLSVVCGFLYIGLGLVAWVCSLCILRCRNIQREAAADEDTVMVEDPTNDVLVVDGKDALPADPRRVRSL